MVKNVKLTLKVEDIIKKLLPTYYIGELTFERLVMIDSDGNSHTLINEVFVVEYEVRDKEHED